MIRVRLHELIAEASFRRGRRVEILEVAQATGIHRTTLSRIGSPRGGNPTLNNLDALCRFFGCTAGELLTYVPDEQVSAQAQADQPSAQTSIQALAA